MTRRWRLFPKYALRIIALVGGMLIASGALGIYFSWRENQQNLTALQDEKAQAAASRIEQYVQGIEQQLGWTALPAIDAAANPLEQRRIEFFKLLRQVPAITEAAWLDSSGHEQVRISRLAMDALGSGADLSSDPAFQAAAEGKSYKGPVYFRKETEPYIRIARAAGGGGVTMVEVNLKFVWDVVSRIRIGDKGLAYVVDSGGTLIAHPDISLVLKKTDLRVLPQVAALSAPPTQSPPVARDLRGDKVLSAHASIPSLRWTVFVESPEAEAFAPLYASIARALLLLAAGLAISVVASFFLARALVRPLQALRAGAEQIGAGDLDRRIEVRTGDELEGLAEQFNKMGSELKASYADLEGKVETRTAELRESLDYQAAISEVLRVTSESPTDMAPVFEKILDTCQHLFATEQLGMFLVGDDGLLHTGAFRGALLAGVQGTFPRPIQESATGIAMLERRAVYIADALNDADVPPAPRAVAEKSGNYSAVFVPMLWRDASIGSIGILRQPPQPFAAKEIALLQTFADQAVIAIEKVRLFNETKEALERQTATSEVLNVISNSVADTAPVFEKILDSCEKLFGTDQICIFIVGDDGIVRSVAWRGSIADDIGQEVVHLEQSVTGRVIRERRVHHVADLAAQPDLRQSIRDRIERLGNMSIAHAPMLWKERGIGSIAVARLPPKPFTDKEQSLLQTFADQAVIAIQNARLFNETKEALEQQTATAEVLQVISSSVADTQPVFEKILESCQHLFASDEQGIALIGDDGQIHLGAHRGGTRPTLEKMFPLRMGGAGPVTSSTRDRRVLHYPDVLHGADVPPVLRQIAVLRGGGSYSQAMAPMLWEGRSIGTIYVTREPPNGFTDKELGLLKTFADQAAIAIQNARLFNETREALEQQTATAEILQVISNSVSDAQPVFDCILRSCERLFDGTHVVIDRLGDDNAWHLAAYAGPRPEELAALYPVSLDLPVDSEILQRRVTHFPDVANAPDLPGGLRRGCEIVGCKALVMAPMLTGSRRIGTIIVGRHTGEPFTAKEIALLQTFADQAVIAIQNAQLFNETKEALDQQTATAEVLQVLSGSVADARPVFEAILDSCERLFASTSLGIYLLNDAGMLEKGAFRSDRGKHLRAVAGTFPLPLQGTATELAMRERRVVHYPDVLAAADAPAPLRRIAEATGNNYSIAFAPMLWEDRGVGAIQVARDPPDPFTDKELALLKTFADQAVIAIQNARQFHEIQDKSRQLEAANKHKSEFLANMSHELRTPLNAIIGFSEVLAEKMFGEVNDKQLEYLHDIHTSGHHLLSLINDILDLSKIEAGRMEIDLSSFDLGMLLDNSMTLVRERASRHGLVLALEVDDDVGDWVADQRKVKQVVINLLSNAVKFTPPGGTVTLKARCLGGSAVEIAVVDTGMGIAPDQQALVFEEFRQSSGDYLRKAEGTGLGLSLAKSFVELHGGTIRVESVPGRGSKFSFVLPHRALAQAPALHVERSAGS